MWRRERASATYLLARRPGGGGGRAALATALAQVVEHPQDLAPRRRRAHSTRGARPGL